MINFSIYLTTIVYAALYHKRKAQPNGTIYLTEDEFKKYFNLVIKDIEEERNVANSFSYNIVTQGEPTYSLNLAPEKDRELVNKTSFSYDAQTKRYYTNASLDGLSLKSVHTYPQSIGNTIVPSGYEQTLNIKIDKQTSKEEEPNK